MNFACIRVSVRDTSLVVSLSTSHRILWNWGCTVNLTKFAQLMCQLIKIFSQLFHNCWPRKESHWGILVGNLGPNHLRPPIGGIENLSC